MEIAEKGKRSAFREKKVEVKVLFTSALYQLCLYY